jgi:NTE family protein
MPPRFRHRPDAGFDPIPYGPTTMARHLRLLLLLGVALAGCAPVRTPPPAAPPPPRKPVVGLALGGGAARGLAHIGVIKMLEASGIDVDVVAGTSAGSVVGALYASGMDAFAMQQAALMLDEGSIRDVRLFSGGLVQGKRLQDYVDGLVRERPLERLKRPFAAVATELETGRRFVFRHGDTGQAVRASCSVPGVFEPVAVGGRHYVDGGLVSPVPVDAARELGADFVIAVDISARSDGSLPEDMLGIVARSVVIMGQHLGRRNLRAPTW